MDKKVYEVQVDGSQLVFKYTANIGSGFCYLYVLLKVALKG